METNDDFQFKPLSQGLGFHPRKKEPQSLRGFDFSEAPSADQDSVTSPKSSTLKPSLGSERTSSEKNVNSSKSNAPTPPVYTIDEGLSLDEMPQFKAPLTRDKQTTLNATRSQMELETKSSYEKNPNKLNTNYLQAPTPSAQTAKQAVNDILKTLKDKKNSAGLAQGHSSAAQILSPPTSQMDVVKDLSKNYQKTTMSWGAAFLDGLLIFSMTLLCMIILLTVTKVDLLKTLSQSSDREVFLGLVGLFALVNFIYMTSHRVILGQTPGEWAFDQRLGQVHEQLELNYIFKTAARTMILLATGVITLPIVSEILGRDLIAQFTRLHLYEKKTLK
jgi:hypothetical protein